MLEKKLTLDIKAKTYRIPKRFMKSVVTPFINKVALRSCAFSATSLLAHVTSATNVETTSADARPNIACCKQT